VEIWNTSTSSTPNCVDQTSGAVTKLKPAAHNREVLVTGNNLHLLKWAMTWHRSALLFDSQASARPQHHARSDFESVFVGFCCPKRWSRVWVQYCQGATEDSPKQFPCFDFSLRLFSAFTKRLQGLDEIGKTCEGRVHFPQPPEKNYGRNEVNKKNFHCFHFLL